MEPILGLDVGDKRIGVAVSDALGMLASPVTTVQRTNDREAVREIRRIAEERSVGSVVVGLPKMLDNTVGIQAEKVLKFVESLRAGWAIPVVLWDERLTTVEAARLLRPHAQPGRREHKMTKKRREYVKENVDQVAATLLLESYLASVRSRQ